MKTNLVLIRRKQMIYSLSENVLSSFQSNCETWFYLKEKTVTKQLRNFGSCKNFTVRRKNCSMAKWRKTKKINLLPEKIRTN
jgi:hypothetical protein